MEIYTVKSIEEPDFGCEGRPEGCEPCDRVVLETADGQNLVVSESDSRLYALDIDEGDQVCLKDGKLYLLKKMHHADHM